MVSKELLILPFDHRSSFSKNLLGFKGDLSESQVKKVIQMKNVVFDAFKLSLDKYKSPENFGILVDEEYGEKIVRNAERIGVNIAMPAEMSGQKEFKFNYGNSFRVHISDFNHNLVKVLVRYNPNNKEINKNQLKRLKLLSDFCEKTDKQLLFELLVPPTEKQLKKFDGDKKKYDLTQRVDDTVKAIKEISKELYVDIWKLEGFDTQTAWKKVIAAIKSGRNAKDFGIIFLGRGESKAKVVEWLKLAAKFKPVIGFAVGRTIFFKPLVEYKEKKIKRDEAVEKISKNYNYFVNLWRRERKVNFK